MKYALAVTIIAVMSLLVLGVLACSVFIAPVLMIGLACVWACYFALSWAVKTLDENNK